MPVAESLCLNRTNVHTMWLLQELYFVKYWAMLAFTKPIGLVQRFLFSFGGRKREKNVAWNNLVVDVVAPIVRDVFVTVLQQLGPKAPETVRQILLSHAQEVVTADIEETLTMFGQRAHLQNTLREAMPKALYWLGTSVLQNWTMAGCMGGVLRRSSEIHLSADLLDEVYVASVHFLHRRYLFGQSVLACSVLEQAWSGIDHVLAMEKDAITGDVVKVLRTHAGHVIDDAVILSVDIAAKRSIEQSGRAEKDEVRARMQRLLRTLVDLGLADAQVDESGALLRASKRQRQDLSDAARAWLHQQRVPLTLFGPPKDEGSGYHRSAACHLPASVPRNRHWRSLPWVSRWRLRRRPGGVPVALTAEYLQAAGQIL